MKRKSQITLYVIIGLVVIGIIGFLLITFQKNSIETSKKNQPPSLEDVALNEYIKQCIDISVIKANEEYGFKEKNKYLYEAFVERRVNSCVEDILNEYRIRNYDVETEEISTNVEFNEETVVFQVDYPITVTKENRNYHFDSVEFTFKLKTVEDIKKTETILLSQDGKANIIIPEGTTAENNGEKVTSLILKIVDKNFDNLENDIVVGNLVYEGLPDKTNFSNPVQISIDYRTKDYPIYLNENSLSIAWWDENMKIWKSVDTTIKNGIATANISHFTKFAVVFGCNGDRDNIIVQSPVLFKQKYSLTHPDIDSSLSPEEQLLLSNEYSEEDVKFCKKEEDYWMEDGETIIPTIEEYLKIKHEEAERIDLSVQELFGESVSFGDGNCEAEVPVNAFCCCNSKGECYPKLTGLQECMDLYEDDFKTFDSKTGNCPDGDYGSQIERKIFGYNNMECIGGNVVNGNSDPGILTLKFLDNGNACIKEIDPAEVQVNFNGQPDLDDKCNVDKTDLVSTDSDGHFIIKIESVSVEPNVDSYCAQCSLAITVRGTGLEDEYHMFTECEAEGDYDLQFENKKLSCKECVPLDGYNNIYVTNGEEKDSNSQECRCTRSLIGTAYCATGEICVEENGKPVMKSGWTPPNDECEKCINPITKENDLDCAITVYPYEVNN